MEPIELPVCPNGFTESAILKFEQKRIKLNQSYIVFQAYAQWRIDRFADNAERVLTSKLKYDKVLEQRTTKNKKKRDKNQIAQMKKLKEDMDKMESILDESNKQITN